MWTYFNDKKSTEMMGANAYSLIESLYPLCRSITGEGVRETLNIIGQQIELERFEIPTGTRAFDWEVPKEWNIKEAFIEDPDGKAVVDFKNHNLHIVSYSQPHNDWVSREELLKHLHSLPEHPSWIPYRTSYYNEEWGFCVSHDQLQALTAEKYRVVIDSEFKDGSLSYGEHAIAGKSTQEFLIFSHTCHPSLCNDNLSGIAVATELAKALARQQELNFSYRFVFAPATIGSITWLSQNKHRLDNIKAGLVVAVAGDSGSMTYKLNRNDNCYTDKIVKHVLSSRGRPYNIIEFSPYGYDERQFCSPGINLPIGSLMRTPNGCYPEYHTSADNLELVQPEYLADTISAYLEVIDVFDNNVKFNNLMPYCEPQLGKRGLYRKTGGLQDIERSILAKLWVLNLSDGNYTLLEIAERANMRFNEIRAAAEELFTADLLEQVN